MDSIRSPPHGAKALPAYGFPTEMVIMMKRGELMNNVAKTTWVMVAILLAIVLIAFIAMRGGQ
jgi:hypothetical protein